MQRSLFVLIAAALVLGGAACGTDDPFGRGDPLPPVEEPDGGTPDGGPINPGDSVSFKNQIVPIFASNCSACHGTGAFVLSGNAAADYPSASSRSNVAKPRESLLFLRPTGNGHPKLFDANSNEAKLILSWIEQGAKNN